jgi:predicted xylose isomerase-like sugar epimerase
VLTIKCDHIRRNIKSESIFQILTDAEVRKRREQTGLGILVVYAVNDDC